VLSVRCRGYGKACVVDLRVYVRVKEVDEGGVFRKVVGMCDENLLGKIFREGDLVLEINEEFFGGDLLELDEALHIAETSENVMAVGEVIVGRLVEVGLAHPESVLRIAGVPYVILLQV